MFWPFAETLLDLSRTIASTAANWWIQSTLLISVGLAVGAICRRRGSAVQSVVYRTTLAAVLAAPLVTWSLQLAGFSGWSIAMPAVWSAAETSAIAQVAPAADAPPVDLPEVGIGVAGTPAPSEWTRQNFDRPSLDVDAGAATDFAAASDFASDTPASASPSLVAPSPPAQVLADAAPVITIYLFGKVAAAASAAWLLVATVLIARMAVAWRRLGQIRRQAAMAEQSVQAACRNLAARLSVVPPAVLRSPYLPSPCLAGLRRPAVLLPETSDDLPVHDVLVHELAHLSRGDCYWNLVRRLANAVLFFQPLMWILSRRIEVTAEEVCDDYVVHLGGDRRHYAHRLVDIAELSQAPFAAAGVGIVSLRSMLGQRVTRIMDTSRSLSTRVGGALLALVLVGGIVGTMGAGLVGLRAGSAPAGEPMVEKGAPVEEATADDRSDDAASDSSHQHITGRVVGPDGQPIAGAAVFAARVVYPSQSPTQQIEHQILAETKSDDQGLFELAFSTDRGDDKRVQDGWHVAAWRRGYGPAWIRDVTLLKDKSPTLRLAPDEPIRGRVVDLEGNPVAGVAVALHSVAATVDEEDIERWIDESQKREVPEDMTVYFAGASNDRYADRFPANSKDGELVSGSPALPEATRTDSDGRFELHDLGPNRLALVELSGPTIAKCLLPVVIRDMEPLASRPPEWTSIRSPIYFGRTFELVAEPTQPIVGTVSDEETGEPLAGYVVRLIQLAGSTFSQGNFLTARTDASGKFRLVGAPSGGGHRLEVAPQADEPYFSTRQTLPEAEGFGPVACDFKLRRGRWIVGKLMDGASGHAVAEATICYLPLRENDHATRYPNYDPTITGHGPDRRFRTEADGSFRVLAIPGAGLLSAIVDSDAAPDFARLNPDEFPRRLVQENGYQNTYHPWTVTGLNALVEVQIDEANDESRHDLQITRGLTRPLTLVDEDGQPIAGARVLGLEFPPILSKPLESANVDVVGLRPDDERIVAVIHPERRLGAALTVGPGDEQTVTLRPCGVARGRVVDEFGEPYSGLNIEVRLDGADNWGRSLVGGKTDADGRFEVLLPPGTTARVSRYSTGGPNISVQCHAEPGAVFDLGDLTDGAKLTEEQTAKMVTVAAAEQDPDIVTVRGRVVDPGGKPAPHADVYVLRWFWNWGDRKPLAATMADAEGRFEISYRKSQFAGDAGRPNQWRETFIASFVEGFGPGWAHYDRLKAGEDALVRLALDDVPIEGRVIDLEGNPVAGVTIEIGSIAQPNADSLDDYLAAIKAGQAISTAYATIDEVLPHHALDHWPKIVTDKNGRFRASGFGRERLVTLHVSGSTIVTDSFRVATRRMEPIVHPAYAYENADDTTQYGATLEYTAAPSRPIEGLVRDADTGEPLVGAEIWSWKFAGRDISGITIARTKSEADGRFRLEGMPKGTGNRIVVVPTDLPYFTAEFDVPNPAGSDPVPLDVELHRGVWVTGRVTDKATGDPVSAHIHYITFPDNQHAQGLKEFDYGRHGMSVQDRFRTDADGRYRVVALPGHGIIGVRAVLQPYPGGQGYHDIEGVENRESFMRFNGVFSPTEKFPTAVKEINVDAGAAENACDFELDPGGRLTIRTVDANGAPLPGVRVTGVSEIDGFMEPMESAEFDLAYFRPGENRTVLLYEPERRLGKALRVKPEDGRDGPLEVMLEPVGVVLGRLVNDGEPASGMDLRIDVAGDNDYGRELRRAATDADGRFRHDAILPGLKYRIVAEGAGMKSATVTKELEVATGETVDLGTIDLANDERPEPMRSGGVEATVQAAATPPQEDRPEVGETLEFAGSVVTPDGKPAADADLYLVFYIPQPAGLLTPSWQPIGRTDANGAFQLTVNPRDFGVGVRRTEALASMLTAVKEGYGFAFAPSGLYDETGNWIERVRARLSETPADLVDQMKQMLAGEGKPLRLMVDDAPLRGRVIDVNGQPVAGARLTLLEIWTGADDDLTAWRNAAREEKADYYSARTQTPLSMNGPQVRSLVRPASTDSDGRFTMRGIGRGRIAELLVEGPGVESARVFARTEAGEAIVLPRERRSPDLGEYTYHPAEFTLVAGPSTPVVGVVRDAASGKPLAGVTVKSQARHGERINGWGQDFVRAVTDAAGRYRLTGLPVGDGNRIAAIAPNDEPYFSTSARAATRGDQESLEINFDLPRGVWIEGRVTDKQTGRGLPGWLDYAVSQDNPQYDLAHSFNVDERDRLQSGDDGDFRIVGLPGPGLVSFMAFGHQDYPRASSIIGVDGTPKTPGEPLLQTVPSILMLADNHAVAEVNPAADDERYELNIQLDGGKLVGRVVDAAGNPVTGFMYSGRIAAFGVWQAGAGDAFALLGYDAAAPRRVMFAHVGRNLAGSLTVSGESPQNLIAKLQAAGKATGRLVDGDGAPLPGMAILPWSPPMSSPADLANAKTPASPPLPPNVPHSQAGEYETDAEGRFEIACLAPGVEYRLRAFDRASMTPARGRAPTISGPIDAVIVVEPGQTLDLGDVKLADREEFTAAVLDAQAEKETANEASGSGPKRSGQGVAAAGSPIPGPADDPAGATAQEGSQRGNANQLSGQVVGPDGKPVRDAKIYWISWSLRGPAPAAALVATTDVEGRFAFDAPAPAKHDQSIELRATQQLAVRADGLGMAIVGGAASGANSLPTIALPADNAPIQGQIVDIDGQPVADARVSVREVSDPRADAPAARGTPKEQGELDLWKNRLMEMQRSYAAPQLPQVAPSARTDAQGRFVLAGIGRDRLVELLIEGERIESTILFVRTEPGQDISVESDGNYLFQPVVIRGATFVQAVGPSKPLTGRVLDLDTGEPIPGATVRTYLVHGHPLSGSRERQHLATVSDAKGKYRITGLPVGAKNGLVAFTTGDDPYVPGGHYVDTSAGAEEVAQDFRLKRGVWATGRVYDAEAKEPLTGELRYYLFRDPELEQSVPGLLRAYIDDRYFTNSNGEFRVPVLAARGVLAFRYSGPKDSSAYPRGAGAESIDGNKGSGTVRMYETFPFFLIAENYWKLVEVHPQDDQAEVRVDMPLSSGLTATVHAVGRPQGEPLAGVDVFGANLHWWTRSDGVDIRIIGLQRGQSRKVLLYHPPTGLVGGATVDDQAASPVEVPLVASGSVRGRLVDEDGEPITDATLNSDYESFQTDPRLGVWPHQPGLTMNPTSLPVDKDGRFQIVGLVPGWNYSAYASARRPMDGRMMNQGIGKVFADVSVKSGQTLDLGDVVVEQPD